MIQIRKTEEKNKSCKPEANQKRFNEKVGLKIAKLKNKNRKTLLLAAKSNG
mgnify:CR=1 FL=1